MVKFEVLKDRTEEYKKFIREAFSQNGLRCYFEEHDDYQFQIHAKGFVPLNSRVGHISAPSFIRRPSQLEIELENLKYKDAVVKSGEAIEKEFGKDLVTVVVYE